MGLRRWSIRLRSCPPVAIPILYLIGLHVLAAGSAAGDAINLNRAETVKNVIGLPTGTLEKQIDTECVFAVTYLANPSPLSLASLRGQEAQTDAATTFLRSASATTSCTANESQTGTSRV